jgi:hypothetical protein
MHAVSGRVLPPSSLGLRRGVENTALLLLMLSRQGFGLTDSQHEDEVHESVVLGGLGLLDTGVVASAGTGREKLTHRFAGSVERTRVQVLVAELAELEDGVSRCLLVGGLGNVALSDQVTLEGGKVVGVDLQVAADARLSLTASRRYAEKALVSVIWCRAFVMGERERNELGESCRAGTLLMVLVHRRACKR